MPVGPIHIVLTDPSEKGSATKSSRRASRTALVLALFAMLSVPSAALSAQEGQSPALSHGKTVILTPDSCASVANGDIILFTWNPAFDYAVEITALHDFSMVFAPAGRTLGKGFIPQGGFELRALPAKTTPEIPTPVADAHNGFLALRFRAHLTTIAAGRYNLVYAAAHPEITPGSPSTPPQMTNSPLQYPFCLDVTSSPVGKK